MYIKYIETFYDENLGKGFRNILKIFLSCPTGLICDWVEIRRHTKIKKLTFIY